MCHATLNHTCQICWSWIETRCSVSPGCTAFAKKRFPVLFRASATHLSSTKCCFFLLGVYTNALKASKTFSYLIASFHLAEWWPGPPYGFPLSHRETSTGMYLVDHCLQLWKKEGKNKHQHILTCKSDIIFFCELRKDGFFFYYCAVLFSCIYCDSIHLCTYLSYASIFIL